MEMNSPFFMFSLFVLIVKIYGDDSIISIRILIWRYVYFDVWLVSVDSCRAAVSSCEIPDDVLLRRAETLVRS